MAPPTPRSMKVGAEYVLLLGARRQCLGIYGGGLVGGYPSKYWGTVIGWVRLSTKYGESTYTGCGGNVMPRFTCGASLPEFAVADIV